MVPGTGVPGSGTEIFAPAHVRRANPQTSTTRAAGRSRRPAAVAAGAPEVSLMLPDIFTDVFADVRLIGPPNPAPSYAGIDLR